MQTIDLDHIRLPKRARVLDLGCGEGRHAMQVRLCTEADIIGLDRSHHDLTRARQKFRELAGNPNSKPPSFLSGDAYTLPFPDATFDAIICSEVLEHLHDYHAALREIRRVLQPGGTLAISVPRYGPERVCWALSRAYHDMEGGHVRIFRAPRLRADIEQLGFTRYAQHWAHGLHSPYWWLRCLFWSRTQRPLLERAWHRMLVWDMLERPWLTRTLEKVLNPVIGKSVVMYFRDNRARSKR